MLEIGAIAEGVVVVKAGAGINQAVLSGNIVVYPNPVSNVLNLSF